MRVYCCQIDILWERPAENCAKVRALLDRVEPLPGSLVILPEMFATGFSMAAFNLPEGDGRRVEAFLAELAREYGVFLLAGVVNLGGGGLGRNEAVVFSPDGALAVRYTKMHPFSLGTEAEHYEAGNEVVTFSCAGCVTAPFICYDLRFPEVFRVAARRGAQLFVVIASWPTVRIEHWLVLLRARAIENQAYVVGVNRCGSDPKLAYPGRSVVVDPLGECVADAGEGETCLVANLDLERVASWRRDFPALRDMRFVRS